MNLKENTYLSILGDSVSTYKGISNDADANCTIGANPYFYREPFPLERTYWMRVARAFDMRLCVNNSWSGGNLSGLRDPSAGVNRVEQLTRADGTAPNFIIVFMGLNDLGRGVDVSVFASDYASVLGVICRKYPDADVCCVNLPDRDERLKARAEAFNQAIDDAVRKAGERFFVVDLFRSRLNNDFYYLNTVDGLHPDEDGMRIIAELIEETVRAR